MDAFVLDLLIISWKIKSEDYTNLCFPYKYENNDKIILKCFQ